MSKQVESLPMLPGATALGGHLRAFRTDAIGLLSRAAKQGDAVRMRFGVMNVLILSSPALVQQALVEQESQLGKSWGLTLFARPLLGQGLLTAKHELHRRQRKLLAPAFVNKRIASYADTMIEHAERGLSRMLAQNEVELGQETNRTTLGIISKTLFDADIGEQSNQVGPALTEAMQSVIGALTSNIPLPLPVPTPRNLRLLRATRALDRIVYRMIEERRSARADRGDLLSLLLAARDEEDRTGMSERQMRDEAMTAFVAGHETMATALSWTLYALAKNPDARAEVEAELDSVLAGRAPTLADLPRLPAVLRALKESMRMYPPAFMVTRRSRQDVDLGSLTLPAGHIAVINIFGVHRRPDAFPRPDQFELARFSKEREAALPRHAYMPFGAGARMCIGNHLAWMEGQLVLASWLSRARFELSDPSLSLGFDPLITLRPKGPLAMRVTRRNVQAKVA